MNRFTERYKTLSKSELLKVIENSSDYQSESVKAAKTEINQRNLSEQENVNAQRDVEFERQEQQKQNKTKAEVARKDRTIGTSVFEAISSLLKSPSNTGKLIKLITAILVMVTVVKWFDEFNLVKYLMTNGTSGWDTSWVLYFISLVFLPLAAMLFGLRRKSGWILVVLYLTYSAIAEIIYIAVAWVLGPLGIYVVFERSLEILFLSALQLLLFGSALWFLTRSYTRKLYRMSKVKMIWVIGIAAAFAIASISQSLSTIQSPGVFKIEMPENQTEFDIRSFEEFNSNEE